MLPPRGFKPYTSRMPDKRHTTKPQLTHVKCNPINLLCILGGSTRKCLVDKEIYSLEIASIDNAIWRETGDIGYADGNGNIFCMGRKDRQLKRNGKRLNLNMIEEVSIVNICLCHVAKRVICT